MAADQQSPEPGATRRERGPGGGPPEAGDLKDDVRRSTQELKGRARESLEQGRESAADKAEDVARAIGDAADRLGERNPSMAEQAMRMSDRIARIADRLRTGNIDELVSEASSLARRNPTLFVLGSVGLGILLSRFLKASGERQSTSGRRSHRVFDTGRSATESMPEHESEGSPARMSEDASERVSQGIPERMNEPVPPRHMAGSAAPGGGYGDSPEIGQRVPTGEPPLASDWTRPTREV
ncbi:MAG: hypothetical protein IRZ28_11370 [Steroidobacteraceae bacterium]|nr:hypothetical protein [Steroidobacteraceae bacterium]